MRIKACLIGIALIIFCSKISAQQNTSDITFSPEDRVLILAPHPDDETIGTGGVIQQALKAGAKVKVACFTNGDHNQFAFIVYEKRLTFRSGEFLHMGEVRRKETLSAMNFLGLNQDDVIFMGYPDFGTMELLTSYWGKTKPYKTVLTRVAKVAYPEAMSPGSPYVGESILKDLKAIISEFKPTKIFVSHPADTNKDHNALYLFLKIVLWDFEGKIIKPKIYPYIIHVSGWPKPRGYHPELELSPPVRLSGLRWERLICSQEEIENKNKAIAFYKSQIGYNPHYLFTFARKDELFNDLPIIKLTGNNAKEIQWQEVKVGPDDKQGKMQPPLSYALNNDNLYIKLNFRDEIDKDFGISVYLLGYSKKTDFAQMPKIYILIDLNGLHLKDKKQTLFIKDINLTIKNKTAIIKIPLSVLGNPEHILSRARTHTFDLPMDRTAWWIIEPQK